MRLIERLERRRLLADPWGASATVMDQDDAAALFPSVTGAGVTVAIMDSGIDYNHPALGGGFGAGFKVKGGFDFVDNDSDPMDTFGHGTNVAGIIAADNFSFGGFQYQGVAPDANLVALRISSGGDVVPNSRTEAALQWIEDHAVEMGISIVNFSFGSGNHVNAFTDPQLSDNFQRLADMGIFFVSPTGNDFSGSLGINFPAADPNVVAVGSVAANDSISTFTQRGPTLDLLAPGENVGTTVRGGGFTVVTLTSFSSPVVAGAAALLKQVDSQLKAKDMLSMLRSSGVRHDDSTGGTRRMYPRVDLDAAITHAFRRKPDLATDVGNNGAANDLAIDREGVLHFVYYDQTVHTIKYATRSTSGFWSATKTIDTTGFDVGAHLSLALNPMGQPSIAYYDGTEGDLEYARFDGTTWKRSTIDSKNIAGQFPSLGFDFDGDPIVAYYRKTSGDLRVMQHDGAQWVRWEVDTTGDTGHFANLGVSKSGTIGVAYGDATTGDLKYAHFVGNGWTTEVVDDLLGIGWPSLAYDASNNPAISYYNAFPADLKFATKETGAWLNTTIGSKGAQGLYTNLWFEGNEANIVYWNRKSNGLFHVFGSISSWGASQLRLGGGQYASAAPNATAVAAAYAWQDSLKLKILTGDLL